MGKGVRKVYEIWKSGRKCDDGSVLDITFLFGYEKKKTKCWSDCIGFSFGTGFQVITGIESWRAVAGGILTGILFMGISRLTEEKIGYGDSLLIIVLGTFLGMWKLLILLLGAFGLAAVVSILLMIKRKFTRKSMIPFVPFLTVAYIGEMLGGMLSGGV